MAMVNGGAGNGLRVTKTDGGDKGSSDDEAEGETDDVGSGKGYSNGGDVNPNGVPTKSSAASGCSRVEDGMGREMVGGEEAVKVGGCEILSHSGRSFSLSFWRSLRSFPVSSIRLPAQTPVGSTGAHPRFERAKDRRSEERRVGKECRN